MGKVYKLLLDVFPQVDRRILKAVAIENSKDADAAVDTILSEILPYLSNKSTSPIQELTPIIQLDDGLSSEEERSQLKVWRSGKNASSSSVSMSEEHHEKFPNMGLKTSAWNGDSAELQTSEVSNFCGKDSDVHESSVLSVLEEHENVPNVLLRSSAQNADSVESQMSVVSDFSGKGVAINKSSVDTDSEELILLGKSPKKSAEFGRSKIIHGRFGATDVDEDYDNINQFQVNTNLETHGLSSFGKNQSTNDTDSSGQSPLYISVSSRDDTILIHENEVANICLNNDSQDLDWSVDLDKVLYGKSTSSCYILGEENGITLMVSSSAQENSPDSLKSDLHVEVGSGNNFSFLTDSDNHGGDASLGLQSKQDPVDEVGNSDNESDLDIVGTHSSQICRTDVLEEIIEDAKNSKRTLFQMMQSVVDLMKEVEFDEEAAEQAKEEDARGGFDILVKVEEIKQMLVHAKEANEMHAGEVYGEKAILATEVRELQNRLISLSEERGQSIAILDEMRQTLEARQAAAEEARTEAEQEKLEKEELARNALAEQEAIMEKVVQESKILQKEAEENSKLHEFLKDRGRTVDSLQGEISVICQDVRLLKQKFDERLPLSKSISSSQTSCILASSGSSVKSGASELIPIEVESAKTPKKVSPAPSVDGQSPRGRPEEDRFVAARKELLEDGWDFFEKDEEFCS